MDCAQIKIAFSWLCVYQTATRSQLLSKLFRPNMARFLLIIFLFEIFSFFTVIVAENDNQTTSNKFIYGPKDMGIFNLTSCSGAPSCGKKKIIILLSFVLRFFND
jgi:hypothetical protein